MNDQQESQNSTSSEPNKVDTAASAACVRSGAFALLLSLALLLLIPYWKDQPRYAALRAYVAYRFNLTSAIEGLDDDVNWQIYKTSNIAAESISIAQLQDLKVDITVPGETREQARPKNTTPAGNHPKASVAKPASPVPPSGLHASFFGQIIAASRIAETLNRLNDSDVLTKTRQVSNFFNFSVARWSNKRGALIYKNALARVCNAKQLEIPYEKQGPPEFVPALDKEALLACLTVHDVRELAQLEQPTVSNAMELGGRIGPFIEIAPGSLPRGTVDSYAATIAVQILLFFVIVYFGAFAREAAASRSFPAPGTLFGAFSKSRWTLLVLFLALWTPPVTSLAVAIVSHKWILSVCVLLVSLAVMSVQFVLQSRSYFHAIDPRVFLRGNRPIQNASPAASAD